MRKGLVVVGVVLLIIGVALLFVPLVPQSDETVSSTSDAPFYAASVGGFSLTGTIPIAVSWTSTAATEVVAGACGGTCQNTSDVTGIVTESGTSGSFTLNQPNGGSIAMGEVDLSGTAANVTFHITTALSTVGTILLVIGILVLIIGVVTGRKPKPMASSTSTSTMPTMDSSAPPAGNPPPPM
jgi:uncharacterized membrane protein